jgi:NAD(P)-dependent dehydrogenase (short-subunit alcohol dehydrogenase family)
MWLAKLLPWGARLLRCPLTLAIVRHCQLLLHRSNLLSQTIGNRLALITWSIMQVRAYMRLLLTQALAPIVKDGGHIVNISSGLTRFSVTGYIAYASAKAAVEVMTRYMAKELGPRRINVNVIAPGAIETDFGGGGIRDNPELNKTFASLTAMGRVGLPDDVGGAVASLLTGDNGWVTAQRIEVSGGANL